MDGGHTQDDLVIVRWLIGGRDEWSHAQTPVGYNPAPLVFKSFGRYGGGVTWWRDFFLLGRRCPQVEQKLLFWRAIGSLLESFWVRPY